MEMIMAIHVPYERSGHDQKTSTDLHLATCIHWPCDGRIPEVLVLDAESVYLELCSKFLCTVDKIVPPYVS